MVFDSKQFQVTKKREEFAIAKWLGLKDDNTLTRLLGLFRKEHWRGQLRIDYSGNGGVTSVIFVEKPSLYQDESEKIVDTES